MEIENSEKQRYFRYLQLFYGENIVDENDLDSKRQRFIEISRHKFNSFFKPKAICLDLYPKRLLFNVTQKCTFNCSHCWVFGSPLAKTTLCLNELEAIYKNTLSVDNPNWTLSGGEFFTLPYYPKILEQFPIQCVYTNAFWGHPANKCQKYIDNIICALNKNPKINKKRFTLILSYDSYHFEGSGGGFPLSTAIVRIMDALYKAMPEISIRISHTSSEEDENKYYPIIDKLQNSGYQIERTVLNDNNSNINTISFSYFKDKGIVKEFFVDTFPVTPISRGLFLNKPKEIHHPVYSINEPIAFSSFEHPQARHQYTIGPDGGISLYEILYAPPVPYYLGNLIDEPWKSIEKKILHDPIAMTLRKEGLAPIIHFMEIYYRELLMPISKHFQTIQQLLYLILINPIRRLFLNTYLLSELQTKGLFIAHENFNRQKITALLKTTDKIEREKEILNLYELRN